MPAVNNLALTPGSASASPRPSRAAVNIITSPLGEPGTRPAFSPPLQFSCAARYDWNLFKDYRAFVSAGASHTGGMFNQPADYPTPGCRLDAALSRDLGARAVLPAQLHHLRRLAGGVQGQLDGRPSTVRTSATRTPAPIPTPRSTSSSKCRCARACWGCGWTTSSKPLAAVLSGADRRLSCLPVSYWIRHERFRRTAAHGMPAYRPDTGGAGRSMRIRELTKARHNLRGLGGCSNRLAQFPANRDALYLQAMNLRFLNRCAEALGVLWRGCSSCIHATAACTRSAATAMSRCATRRRPSTPSCRQ